MATSSRTATNKAWVGFAPEVPGNRPAIRARGRGLLRLPGAQVITCRTTRRTRATFSLTLLQFHCPSGAREGRRGLHHVRCHRPLLDLRQPEVGKRLQHDCLAMVQSKPCRNASRRLTGSRQMDAKRDHDYLRAAETVAGRADEGSDAGLVTPCNHEDSKARRFDKSRGLYCEAAMSDTMRSGQRQARRALRVVDPGIWPRCCRSRRCHGSVFSFLNGRHPPLADQLGQGRRQEFCVT